MMLAGEWSESYKVSDGGVHYYLHRFDILTVSTKYGGHPLAYLWNCQTNHLLGRICEKQESHSSLHLKSGRKSEIPCRLGLWPQVVPAPWIYPGTRIGPFTHSPELPERTA